MIRTQHELIDFLVNTLRETKNGINSLEIVNQKLRKVFLQQNSETPDNLESIEQIEYGEVLTGYQGPTFGLKIRGKNILLAEVVWRALEGDGGRDLILSQFPELTSKEAEAVLRICTVILLNLQARVAPSSTD
jgi:hypothetical protein